MPSIYYIDLYFVGPSAVALEHYPFKDYFPLIIRDYIQGVVDVRADGNCGFRAASSFVFGNEENWKFVRKAIASELKANRSLYQNFYVDPIDQAIDRIEWYEENCREQYWMVTPEDLHAIATYFNVVIIYIAFGTNEHSTASCCTILPLYVSERNVTTPSQEICIAHIPVIRHFVRLNLSANCPMPPIPWKWSRLRQESVRNWERPYADRFQLWHSLANVV